MIISSSHRLILWIATFIFLGEVEPIRAQSNYSSPHVISTLAGSGLPPVGSTNGTGTAASFNSPSGVAIDSSGNVYVADQSNHKIRKITAAGEVSTFAGSDASGSTDGPGTVASFWGPSAVAVDVSGNVYVADSINNKIRKITSAGVVSTLAGSGSVGSTNATGAAASFNGPKGVAVDSSGNVYVADSSNHKIRKITAAGVVSTLAGSGSVGSANATGAAASFNRPSGVTVDSSGNIYVADFSNQKIRKITATGVVSTFAGSGSVGNANATGAAASFNYPFTVAVDSSSNVYVADTYNHMIRKITAAGVVSTLAESFNYPSGVAVDNSGNVYVGDSSSNQIRKITVAGVVTTLAGIVSADGLGAIAGFHNPYGLTVDASGNVYVADTANHKIRKIDSVGVVSTLAGSGNIGSADGTGAAASFFSPTGVVVNSMGEVYVADRNNHKIRKITPAGVVTTLAGSGNIGSADGAKAAASFYFPNGITMDSNGNIYVADRSNHKIRKITSAGAVSTLAGSGTQGGANGTGPTASFYSPCGVAVDGSGNVYVADEYNHRIRKITATGLVSTLAGTGSAGSADGTGISASFNYPTGLSVNSSGDVYVADQRNHKIRKITSTGVVTTLAGTGNKGSADGASATASFNFPNGIALDSSGNVYVVDTSNHKIRKAVPGPTQSIVFPTLNPKTYGDASFPVSATASSGLPVTFSITSGPAAVSGNTISINGIGTVTVRASQAGNASYLPAPNVDQSFFVAQKSQVITFNTLNERIFGEAAFTISATATSGLPVTFSIVSGPATISGNLITLNGAGTVIVRASQAGSTYEAVAAPVDQSFTVAKAIQSISFAAIGDKIYGDSAFTLEAICSSELIPTFTVMSGPATVVGNSLTITGAGTIEIRAPSPGMQITWRRQPSIVLFL